MAFPDVSPGSFDFYEGIRIVVPGAFFVVLADVVLSVLVPDADPTILESAGNVIVLILASGLLLYFVDIPSKSAIYNNDLPGQLVEKWFGEWDLEAGKALNHYFLVLDILMPKSISSRALYMGSIFRIGFEAVLMMAVAETLLWSAYVLNLSRTESRPSRLGLMIATGIIALVVARALVSAARSIRGTRRTDSSNVAKNDPARNSAMVIMGREIKRDLGPYGLLAFGALTAAMIASFFYAREENRLLLTSAGGFFILWLIRFIGGTKPTNVRQSRPIKPLSATLLLAVPAIGFSLRIQSVGESPTRPTHLAACIVLTLAVLVLVATRGFERRLKGAFGSQKYWLELNKELIRKSALGQLETEEERT